MDILNVNVLTNIEASAHAACITFTSDVFVILILLILIESLLGTDSQVSIIQLKMKLIFLESRKINCYFIAIIFLLNICLHHILCMFAIQCFINIWE